MKTAWITGASRGLGAALMEELAEQGWRVVGIARGPELATRVEALRGRGLSATAVPGDVGALEELAAVAAQAHELAGPPDLLVHNASSLGPVPLRPLSQVDEEEFVEVLRVNLLGPARLTRLVAGGMALRGGGQVVFISSDAAEHAYPGWGVYGVSKRAADHLAAVWAAEVPAVRFVTVDPGEMDTQMHAAAIPDADPASLQRPSEVAKRLVGEWGVS